jgi:hypothetical protein
MYNLMKWPNREVCCILIHHDRKRVLLARSICKPGSVLLHEKLDSSRTPLAAAVSLVKRTVGIDLTEKLIHACTIPKISGVTTPKISGVTTYFTALVDFTDAGSWPFNPLLVIGHVDNLEHVVLDPADVRQVVAKSLEVLDGSRIGLPRINSACSATVR